MASVIDTVNSNAKASATSAPSATPSNAKAMEDRFMTLFLAQLQNQDPLNPMENAEMTSQLAQMNMVSGLETLNKSMQTLMGSYDEALSLQAANLIGKNVLVPGSSMTLTENGGLAGVQLDGPADKVEVVITNAQGQEVSRQNLGAQDAGAIAFIWDGKDAQGNQAPEGQYKVNVAASLAGTTVTSSALQAGTVSALSRGKDGFTIEVAGLGNVTLDDVKQVF